MFRKILCGIAITITATTLHADVRPFASLGYDTGGDKLSTAYYISGKEQKITAGAGLIAEVGGAVGLGSNMDTQLSVGYKIDNAEASNGNLKFKRVYLNALGVYSFGKYSAGAGVTYHLNPMLTGDGILKDTSVDFENALGGIVQGGYSVSRQGTAGLRATFINYEASKGSKSVDGNAIGLFYTHKF